MQLTRVIAVLTALALLVPTGIADWPQFRHDDEHTSLADQAGAIQTPYEPWTFDADGSIASSPAVTTVDGDTTIVVGSYPAQSTPGTVYAITPEGETLWSTTPTGSTGGYIASPTVEDLDGDDVKEVVVPSLDDSTLRVFDARDGSQEWSAQVGDTSSDLLASSPVVADLDDTDGKEIALGGSTSDQDGSLLVYDDDGDQLQAIELDGPAWSTPLYEDLDGDDTRELVIATGVPDTLSQLFPSAKTGGESLYAFERSGDTWSIDWQVDLSGPALGSPAAEDLDADGTPEIVVGAQGGHFYAVEPDGTVQADHEANVGPLVAISSPAIADVDQDGTPEVAVGVSNGIQSLELTSEGFVDDGRIELPPVDGQDPWVAASPAVADIDGDEDPDLLGSTVPINVSDEIVNSDALPGRMFAVDGASLADADTQPRWSVSFPDDGGISGPIPADVDDDGRSEVLAGEGIPIIGNGSALHYVDAANPVVEEITATPAEPTTQDEITFEAEVSDEDTDASDLDHDWRLGDGQTASGPAPTHTYADNGTYTVELTVEDPEGHSYTDTLELDVANVAPTVDADVATTPGSLEASFDAGTSDPDGTVDHVEWRLGDGATVDAEDTTHTYDTGGTYEATFEAVDDDGAATTETVDVHVNRFPSLDGPAEVDADEGRTLSLEFSYEDPDGDDVTVVDVANAPDASAQVHDDVVDVTWVPPYDLAARADTPVPVTLNVTIEDTGQPSGQAHHEVTVHVANTNRAPAIDGPERLATSSGQTDTIEGTVGDPDGNPVDVAAEDLPSYASFATGGDSWQLTLDPSTGAQPATHEVTLTADDGLDTTTRTLTLEVLPNQPPEVAIEGPALADASTVQASNSVAFQADARDPDGDAIARHTWTMDEITRQGDTFEHRFREHGTYTVQLEAWDENQASATATHTIDVDDALTGDIAIQPSDAGPTVDRLVTVKATYDDGTPLAKAPVNLTLHHEDLDDPTWEANLTTDEDGRLQTHLTGDEGLGLFLPGQHTLEIETTGPSLADAAVQDRESLAMSQTFDVSLP